VIRVALLGAGYAQDFHARAVREHPGAELVAVANWREPSAKALADRHGIPRVTTDWEEIAASRDVDAAIIGTPNALHAPQAVTLLRAGKHVMVEKPMATSVAECDQMIEASHASNALLMVAHCWRFRDEVRTMRERIVSGELGEIVKTHGYGLHAAWGPGGWFVDPALAGGGALVDMGVHAIDTARFLLGDPLPTRVCAAIGTRLGAMRWTTTGSCWSRGPTA
jgi:predicted dehydrogenase